MMVSASIFHCISLDIKRGLSNKRFWAIIGLVIIISLLHMILIGIRPLTLYYFGGENAFDMWRGRVYTGQSEIQNLTGMVFFANFFPFIGATAYAYTIIDDRRRGYYMQQVQRVGFSKYYWSKMIASGILGGFLDGYIGWGGDHTYLEVTNPWVWWMLGGIKYFVLWFCGR